MKRARGYCVREKSKKKGERARKEERLGGRGHGRCGPMDAVWGIRRAKKKG